MKQKLRYVSALFLAGMACLLATSCQEDREDFDNKAFVSNSSLVETLLLMPGSYTQEAKIRTAIARPENRDVAIVYTAEPRLVEQYNLAYYDHAVALPAACYTIPEKRALVKAGGVEADDVTVVFDQLQVLNSDSVYVLPVTVSYSDVPVLESRRTTYFVFKGAALINTVANISKNKLKINFTDPAVLNGLEELTVEALVRVDKFGKLISTLMGIEGGFLLRFGDAGLADNQLQLATSSGNVTDPAWTINTGEWTHVALTFEAATGEVSCYINGVKKGLSPKVGYRRAVNWGNASFWIGYSYEDGRYLDGDIAECRVWNRILSAEEIAAKNHFYTVSPDAEGLAAYWKFNEGSGSSVKDHTANGNNAVALSPLEWKSVELPSE